MAIGFTVARPDEELQVRILGPLEVLSSGTPCSLGGLKQRAVLAVLATHAGSTVGTDRLIEALWGETPPATATTTVQVYVSRLRKMMGSNAIVSEGGGYRLNVEPEQLDGAHFEQLLATGRELHVLGRAEDAVAVLSEALSLWRGSPLADFAYDSWAQPEINRLDEQRLACVEERFDAELDRGAGAELVAELRELVPAHPLRERLQRQLILALYRAGRQADALEAYHSFKRRLDAELGLEPSADLKELERRILQQDADLVAAAPNRLPSGTVTLLATDIEGSTRMLQSFGDRYAELLAQQRRILSETIGAYGGTEIDSQGDSVLVAFPRASDAVHAAAETQSRLAATDWPNGNEVVPVRIGIHTGEPIVREGRYVGLDVHRVARICAAAHGGQIVLSRETRELLETLQDDLELADLGSHRLKDLEEPERLFQLNVGGLEGEFPPLKSLNQTNLPVPATRLVGRERELQEVLRLLRRDDVRLLTLTGAGGTGKTRLALRAAEDALPSFSDGAWFVNLAPLADPALVPVTIAQSLSLGERAGEALAQTLATYLRERELLLVVDNFEHVAEAAPFLAELGAAAPALKVLVTSRAALHLSAEHEYPLRPLVDEEAIALFVERGRAIRPDFAINGNRLVIEEICRRLDHLPLAIELAAARIKLLSEQALLDHLAERLRLLTGGARDLHERQRTLRNTIDWSYNLLSQEEQLLFARLSVFAGGRTLEAIEEICSADSDLDVLEGVESLLDKSLLRRDDSEGGDARFVMLETIQDYARERLEDSSEADQILRRHAAYFARVAEEAWEGFRQGDQGSYLARLDAEQENLRTALMACRGLEEGELLARIACSLPAFWEIRGLLAEGRSWLERVGRSDVPAALRGRALTSMGALASRQGDTETQETSARKAVDLCRRLDDKAQLASALLVLGSAAFDTGRLEEAKVHYEEAADLAREAASVSKEISAKNNLACIALEQGDYERALGILERNLALARELGDEYATVFATLNLGYAHLAACNLDAALAHAQESLQLAGQMGYAWEVACAFDLTARIAAARAEPERATRLFAASRARLEAIGAELPSEDLRETKEVLKTIRSQLGEANFQKAWAAGEASDEESALAYVPRQTT